MGGTNTPPKGEASGRVPEMHRSLIVCHYNKSSRKKKGAHRLIRLIRYDSRPAPHDIHPIGPLGFTQT